MKSLKLRAAVYALVICLGILSALPNLLPQTIKNSLPQWYSNNTLSLGLDLRGGAHLLLDVDTQELIRKQTRAIETELIDALSSKGIASAITSSQEDSFALTLDQPASASVKSIIGKLSPSPSGEPRRFNASIDDKQIVVRLSQQWRDQLTQDIVERSLEVVRKRINETGLVEPSVTKQGASGIAVQMPGVADPKQIRELLGTTAKMSFHWLADPQDRRHRHLSLPDAQTKLLYTVEKEVAMEGDKIRDARLGFNSQSGKAVVNFSLDHQGAKIFGDITAHNIGRRLAIVLDDQVITAPVIQSTIASGRGEISGSFSPSEASKLALLLRAGALPAPLHLIEERTVGPDVGRDAIAMGAVTGLIGAAMVFVFMLAIYGRWGVIACTNLAINITLMFAVLSLLGATLTLPGIAGIILTIGMAVDANILINERIREESEGKSALHAIREGFDRAYRTILDANITTLIAVSLLFLFGSGPVKGFAVTIAIGLLTSMFTTISLTRLLMEWRARRRGREALKIAGARWNNIFSTGNFNFLRYRFLGLTLSVLLSILSVTAFIHPGLKYGVDFTGGTSVEVQANTLTVEDLRSNLEHHAIANASIQETGAAGHYLLRVPLESTQTTKAVEQTQALKDAVLSAQASATFPRVDTVGPKVSGGFAEATILAILLAGAGMLGFLWLRFEAHFALAATITIALDLSKTIGFLALTGIEFNLAAVAALLALIGYSINDKVVVFDRIRENFRLRPSEPILNILNTSIRATLTRTIFTTATTFLALAPMGVFGGSAVASFAVPMLFGIVIGTSSSIFVASPILYLLCRRRLKKGLPQLRPGKEEIKAKLAQLP